MMNYQEIGRQIGTWLGLEDIDRFLSAVPNPPVPQPQAQPPMPQQMPQPMPMPQPPAPMMPPGGNGGMSPQGLPPALLMALLSRMNGQQVMQR